MRARTRLTAPPGHEPDDDLDVEWYSPALDIPYEPVYPSRWRGPLVTFVLLGVVIIALVAGVRIATTGQSEDPSLQGPQPTATP